MLIGSIVVLWSCTPVQPQTGDSAASAVQIAALQKKIDAIEQEQKKLGGAIEEFRLRRQFEESSTRVPNSILRSRDSSVSMPITARLLLRS